MDTTFSDIADRLLHATRDRKADAVQMIIRPFTPNRQMIIRAPVVMYLLAATYAGHKADIMALESKIPITAAIEWLGIVERVPAGRTSLRAPVIIGDIDMSHRTQALDAIDRARIIAYKVVSCVVAPDWELDQMGRITAEYTARGGQSSTADCITNLIMSTRASLGGRIRGAADRMALMRAVTGNPAEIAITAASLIWKDMRGYAGVAVMETRANATRWHRIFPGIQEVAAAIKPGDSYTLLCLSWMIIGGRRRRPVPACRYGVKRGLQLMAELEASIIRLGE